MGLVMARLTEPPDLERFRIVAVVSVEIFPLGFAPARFARFRLDDLPRMNSSVELPPYFVSPLVLPPGERLPNKAVIPAMQFHGHGIGSIRARFLR